jgi:hypothetical protein
MTIFTALFIAYALLLIAVVAWIAWLMWSTPRRERVQVDELEAAWALTADEPVEL